MPSERSTHYMFYSTLIGVAGPGFDGNAVCKNLYRLWQADWPTGPGLSFCSPRPSSTPTVLFRPDPSVFPWKSQTVFLDHLVASGVIGLGFVRGGPYMLMPLQIPSALDRTMCRPGEVSYSFYLLHGMVIFLVFKTRRFTGSSGSSWNALVNATILFVLVWLVAQISYHTIERPFLMVRKRYVDEQGERAGRGSRSLPTDVSSGPNDLYSAVAGNNHEIAPCSSQRVVDSWAGHPRLPGRARTH